MCNDEATWRPPVGGCRPRLWAGPSVRGQSELEMGSRGPCLQTSRGLSCAEKAGRCVF